jgi:hypothetical protein
MIELVVTRTGSIAQVFNGNRFYMRHNGYYQSPKTVELIHRAVWASVHGDIPDGYTIHHKDGNKANNELHNLDMLLNGDHVSLHKKKR